MPMAMLGVFIGNGAILNIKGDKIMSKINKWLTILWEMNKDESNKDISELQSFLKQQRRRIELEQKYINKEDKNEKI